MFLITQWGVYNTCLLIYIEIKSSKWQETFNSQHSNTHIHTNAHIIFKDNERIKLRVTSAESIVVTFN